MEINPYKVLEIQQNYTVEQLRAQYKKIALAVHPDKTLGNSDYMFVTRCYKMLLDELNKKNSDKQFFDLKHSFSKNQEKERQYVNTNITPPSDSRFDVEQFNTVFEKYRGSDVMDTGYDEWMNKNKLIDAPKLQKNITPDSFNSQFEKHADLTKDKTNKQIIRFKEPEALQMCKKLNFIELGTDSIDDFSGDNQSNRGLNYMDYRIAHSTTRLVDPNNVKKRNDFRTIDDIERDRGNINKLSAKELGYIDKFITFKQVL